MDASPKPIASARKDKAPMTDIHAARDANAKRIMALINDALTLGHWVFDADDERVEHPIVIEGDATSFQIVRRYHASGGGVILYDSDTDCDDGAHTPIKEFNARFAAWYIIDPSAIKPLIQD